MNFFYHPSLFRWSFSKIWRIMRITMILLFIGLMQTFATSTYSQNTKLSLKMEDASLESILNQIEKISEFHFFYKSNEINQEARHSIDVKGQTIDEVLKTILENSTLSYKIFDKYIAIVSKKNANESLSNFMQQKTVSGKVTDQTGATLPGASVVVKGTTTGVITDNSGNYSIGSPENATLLFSFVGMKTQEIAVGNKTNINVTLEEDAIGIEEVVAVGYGSQKKRDLIGSIATVKGGVLNSSGNSTNFTSLLQGQAAGVSVQSSSGKLGAGVNIKIRGLSSISAGTNPLYIIDGVPIFADDILGQSPMSLVNSSDIESIQVLKDAAATSIYGSRGSNGVVLITTKTGTSGKPSVNVNYDTGISDLPLQQIKIGTSAQWFEMEDLSKGYIYPNTPFDINNDLYATQSYQTEKLTRDQALTTNTDWKKVLMRQGSYRNANLSVVGGNKMAQYFIAGSYRKDKGIMRNEDLERSGLRVNVDLNPINNLSIGTKINLNVSKRNNSGGTFDQILTYRFMPVYSLANPSTYWNPLGGNPAATNDPANVYDNLEMYRALVGAYAQYSFPFLKGLSARTEFSIDFLQANKNHYEAALIRTDGTTYDLDNSSTSKTTNSNFYLTYDKEFGKHNINLVFGTEGQRTTIWTRNMEGKNLIGPFQELGTPNLKTNMYSGLSGENYRLAYFGRANYKFKERYFAGFSMRRDGSTVFTDDYRWGNFMAFSAGWIISDEPFMENFGKKHFLKLRGSFGQTGNANIPSKLDGSGYQTGLAYGSSDITATNGTLLSSLGVKNLTWETTNNADAGVDFGFFNNKINGSFAYYNKYVRDLLLAVALPPSTGISSGTIWNNIGDLVNQGVELSVSSLNVRSKNFTWQTIFNISFNHNEVKKLTPQIDEKGTGMVGSPYITKVGYGIRDYYMGDFAQVDPQNGLPMIYVRDPDIYKLTGETKRLKDANGKDVLIMANATNIGNNYFHFYDKNQIPKYYGGITNKFNYKAFDFSFLLTFSGGNYIYDSFIRNSTVYPLTKSILVDAWNNTWKKPGDNAKYMRILWGSNQYPDPITGKSVSFGDPRAYTTQFLYKGDYIKLKSVTMGYTLPMTSATKKMFQELRLYASFENLYTLTRYPGWDPEGQSNVGAWLIPQLFSASFGVSVKF